MASKILTILIFIPTVLFGATLRTTDFQQSLNARAARNYVKNSGAEKNALSVTASGGSLTRSTTTPIKGAAHFAVDASSSGQTYTWAAEDLQPELLGLACEASFKYSGDGTLYKAYASLAGSRVSAEVTLINAGSLAQSVSIIFPCGSSATDDPAVVIESTSASAAAISVDNVFLGESSNIGSVAQAEAIVHANRITSNQSIGTTTATTVVFNGENLDVYSEYNPSTGELTLKRSGRFLFSASVRAAVGTAAEAMTLGLYKNGTIVTGCLGSNTSDGAADTVTLPGCPINGVSGDVFTLRSVFGADAAYEIVAANSSFFSVVRLPSSSELVLRGNVTNVAVEASGTPTGSLSAANATIWGTENRDTASAYNPSTGEFTAPYAGDFCWNAGVSVGGTEALDNSVILSPYVAGAALTRFDGTTRVEATSTTSTFTQSNGCTYLSLGQILTFRTNASITGAAFVAGASNYLSITSSSQALPQPWIPGSVFAARPSSIKDAIFRLTCSSSSSIVENEDGAVATIGNISSGACSGTFPANYWNGKTPLCVASRPTATVDTFATISATSATAFDVVGTNAGAAAATTFGVIAFCRASN